MRLVHHWNSIREMSDAVLAAFIAAGADLENICHAWWVPHDKVQEFRLTTMRWGDEFRYQGTDPDGHPYTGIFCVDYCE